ncbi:hypothetical protein B0H13DRAFT_2129241 [Mycena leptocephala]|nr:hypothetical protein B0H13DRAFT_2129241 [Mycena leptocephala]
MVAAKTNFKAATVVSEEEDEPIPDAPPRQTSKSKHAVHELFDDESDTAPSCIIYSLIDSFRSPNMSTRHSRRLPRSRPGTARYPTTIWLAPRSTTVKTRPWPRLSRPATAAGAPRLHRGRPGRMLVYRKLMMMVAVIVRVKLTTILSRSPSPKRLARCPRLAKERPI